MQQQISSASDLNFNQAPFQQPHMANMTPYQQGMAQQQQVFAANGYDPNLMPGGLADQIHS